jgi:hypothetical protein
MKGLVSKNTARRMQPAAKWIGHPPLFSAYEIKLDEADYSNLVSIYDALPRFSWASKTVHDMSAMTTARRDTEQRAFQSRVEGCAHGAPPKNQGSLRARWSQ